MIFYVELLVCTEGTSAAIHLTQLTLRTRDRTQRSDIRKWAYGLFYHMVVTTFIIHATIITLQLQNTPTSRRELNIDIASSVTEVSSFTWNNMQYLQVGFLYV